MSAIDHLSKICCVKTSEMKVTWFCNHQMFRKVLVCSFYRKFQLKILLFGKWRDEVVQIQSRRIRKATLCKTLTYLERTESPLSPKVSLTTICDLCLLLRLPDRRGYFPLLCGSWLHFFCSSSIGTTEVVRQTWPVPCGMGSQGQSCLHGIWPDGLLGDSQSVFGCVECLPLVRLGHHGWPPIFLRRQSTYQKIREVGKSQLTHLDEILACPGLRGCRNCQEHSSGDVRLSCWWLNLFKGALYYMKRN